jgi:hypothetical protein
MTRHGVMDINNNPPAPLTMAAVNGPLDALIAQFFTTIACWAKIAGIKTAAVRETTLYRRTLQSLEQIDRLPVICGGPLSSPFPCLSLPIDRSRNGTG